MSGGTGGPPEQDGQGESREGMMERTRRIDRLRESIRAYIPTPLKERRAKLREVRQVTLEKVVNAFFPTNSSGNNVSRG